MSAKSSQTTTRKRKNKKKTTKDVSSPHKKSPKKSTHKNGSSKLGKEASLSEIFFEHFNPIDELIGGLQDTFVVFVSLCTAHAIVKYGYTPAFMEPYIRFPFDMYFPFLWIHVVIVDYHGGLIRGFRNPAGFLLFSTVIDQNRSKKFSVWLIQLLRVIAMSPFVYVSIGCGYLLWNGIIKYFMFGPSSDIAMFLHSRTPADDEIEPSLFYTSFVINLLYHIADCFMIDNLLRLQPWVYRKFKSPVIRLVLDRIFIQWTWKVFMFYYLMHFTPFVTTNSAYAAWSLWNTGECHTMDLILIIVPILAVFVYDIGKRLLIALFTR